MKKEAYKRLCCVAACAGLLVLSAIPYVALGKPYWLQGEYTSADVRKSFGDVSENLPRLDVVRYFNTDKNDVYVVQYEKANAVGELTLYTDEFYIPDAPLDMEWIKISNGIVVDAG